MADEEFSGSVGMVGPLRIGQGQYVTVLQPGGGLGVNTATPIESVDLEPVGTGANQTNRLRIATYEETNGQDTCEQIRLYALTNAAKNCIAFYDQASARSRAWVQLHDYLHNYPPVTVAASAVNTTTDIITVGSGLNWPSGWQVQFTTDGTLPAGLLALTNYYISLSSGTTAVYNSTSDAQSQINKVDLTSQGTGNLTITPVLAYSNNRHHHFGIEIADSTDAKQTRISMPYGYDTCEIVTGTSNFSVVSGLLRVLDTAGANRDIQMGGTLSDVFQPDSSHRRWVIRTNSVAEGGSNAGSNFQILNYDDTGTALVVPFHIERKTGKICLGGTTLGGAELELGTSASTTYQVRINRAANTNTAQYLFTTNSVDKWAVGMRNDSTDDFHLRDTANARSLIRLSQSGYAALGNGLRFTPPAAKTSTSYNMLVTDCVILIDATAGAYTVNLPAATGSGQFYIIKKVDASANAVTVTRAGSDNIESGTTVALASQWNSVTLIDYASAKWAKVATT